MCCLCSVQQLTYWYYSDDDCWIAEDLQRRGYIKRILSVYKPHNQIPSLDITAKILNKMIEIAQGEGYFNYEFDGAMSIVDHWHIKLCIIGKS